ncbi:uncharacterized protein METZ01_LOCUS511965, partial [marine metagenome]
PDLASFHYSLGNAYKKLKRYDEALSEYKLTLKYDPKHVDSMNNRGVIYLTLNLNKLAEKEFESVLNLAKDHPSALNNLAGIRFSQGHYRKALILLDRYLLIKPNDTHVQEARRAIHLILDHEVP